jgi:hypothetical protein
MRRRFKWVVIVMVAVLFVATSAVVALLYLHARQQQAQRENCEKSGNPLRQILRAEQVEDLESPHDPRIHKLFPEAPIALAEKIIRENNVKHRRRIRELHLINCKSIYGD